MGSLAFLAARGISNDSGASCVPDVDRKIDSEVSNVPVLKPWLDGHGMPCTHVNRAPRAR